MTMMCNLVVRNTVVSLETETRFTVPFGVRQSVRVSMCGITKYTTSLIKKAQSVLFCVSCSYLGFGLGVSFCAEDVPLFTMKDTAAKSGTSAGWGDSGWDDDSWGDPFVDVQTSKPPPTSAAKSQTADESRRLRQEERKKKQEAARQKRAAGIGSRPKLGAKSD